MAQFDVYENRGDGKSHYPYFMDIQSPLLERLKVRVVIPLTHIDNLKPVRHLHPRVTIGNQQYILMTNLLTSVSTSQLKEEPVMNADIYRNDVIAAIDLLVTGF